MAQELDWTADSKGFGLARPSDDFLHGRCDITDPSLTETWFWAFQQAEAGLHGFVYIWLHPNLDVCMGGLFAHFGDKAMMLACELSDFVTYARADIFDAAGNITLPNGLRIAFEEPMQRARITYDNPVRGFRLDMIQQAFMPAAMRSNNKHFEQGMRCTGTVAYEGRDYALDHLTVRDRSWQEPRSEAGLALPPYTWMTGAFSEDFAFTVAAHDDPAREPEWRGVYAIDSENAFKDGWVHHGGRTEKIVACSKLTRRHPDTLAPRDHQVTMTTQSGRTYRLQGTVVSVAPMTVWHNNLLHVGLTRWTCEGMDGIGWGDTQEVKWNDYVARFAGRAD
ncbi:hypothetical protein SAMN02927924_00342 [Sphingobium faniae]|nr:hypothetical protein SAMN02927924_00342 [Sphingobium faniae]